MSYLDIDQILFKKESEELEQEKRMAEAVSSGDIFKVMPFLRYPQLECGSWRDWRNPPDDIKRKLRKVGHTRTDVVEVLTGHRGKAIRKAVEGSSHLLAAMMFGPLLKDPNNVHKFFDWKSEESKPLSDWFKLSKTIEYPLFKKGFRLIRKCYQDEAPFANALIRFAENLAHGYDREKDVFPVGSVCYHISDIQRQYDAIRKVNPDYKISYEGDIQKLHDDLSRDYNRMKHENETIPYETEEKERYERTVDGYTFVLAKDTHQLLDAGAEMRICVGSYREEALAKKTTIALAYSESGELRLCLEVKPYFNEKKKLQQAKLKRNQSPDREEALVVKKWCNLCRIDSEGNYDLKKAGEQPEALEVVEQPIREEQFAGGYPF